MPSAGVPVTASVCLARVLVRAFRVLARVLARVPVRVLVPVLLPLDVPSCDPERVVITHVSFTRRKHSDEGYGPRSLGGTAKTSLNGAVTPLSGNRQ